MADPVGIATNIKLNASFDGAVKAAPTITFAVKPDVIPQIISNLEKLKGRTDDSSIVQKGSNYSFVDKRTGLPLAELDSQSGTLSMYKSPKDMAARIDSAFISEGTITKFIEESKLPKNDAKSSPANPSSVIQIVAIGSRQ